MALGLNEFKKRFGKKPIDPVSPEDRFKKRLQAVGPKLEAGRKRGSKEVVDVSNAVKLCVGKKDWDRAADLLDEMAPKVAVDEGLAASLREELAEEAKRAFLKNGVLPASLEGAHDAAEAVIVVDDYDGASDQISDFKNLVDDQLKARAMWVKRAEVFDGKFEQIQIRTQANKSVPSQDEKALGPKRFLLRDAISIDDFGKADQIWQESGPVFVKLLSEPADKSPAALKDLYEKRLATAQKSLDYWIVLAGSSNALLTAHQPAIGKVKADVESADAAYKKAEYDDALTNLDRAVAAVPGLKSAVKAQDEQVGAVVGSFAGAVAKAIKDKKLPASVPIDLNIKALESARIKRGIARNNGDYVQALLVFDQYEGGYTIIWEEMKKYPAQPEVSPKAAEYQKLIKTPERAALTKALNAKDADLAAFRAQPGAAKLLDDMVGEIGGKADTKDKREFVQAAMKARFGLSEVSGGEDGKGMSTKALPRMYQLFKDLPASHTTDNELITSVERQKAHDTSWHSSDKKKIVLKAGKTGKAGGTFDETTLHEIAHGVDLKFSFMRSNGKSRSFGGWQEETKESVMKVAGDGLGFFKYFESKKVPRDLLEKYLSRVFAGANTKTMQEQFEAANDPTAVSADALKGHVAIKHAAEGQKKVKEDTDAQRDLMFAARKLIKDKEPTKGMISTIVEKVAYGEEPEKAIKALLDSLEYNGDLPDDEVWKEMAVHPAIDFAANVGLKNGSSGLWDQGDAGAKRCAVNGRVYQEAYANDWVSYMYSARGTKVSDYQFRHRMEWFAECYSRFFMNKLADSHPLASWLQKQKETAKPPN